MYQESTNVHHYCYSLSSEAQGKYRTPSGNRTQQRTLWLLRYRSGPRSGWYGLSKNCRFLRTSSPNQSMRIWILESRSPRLLRRFAPGARHENGRFGSLATALKFRQNQSDRIHLGIPCARP